MAQMFGTRALPPAEAVPGEVADAIEAWREAQARTGRAKAALGEHRRLGIAAARRKDVEQHAAALEQQKSPPKGGEHERRADQKLRELERAAEAAELVESRARARMDERIEKHQGAIAHAAERRAAEARKRFLATVDELATAADAVREALAIKAWAAQPTMNWKVRGLGVPVPRHADSEPSVDAVLDGLRRALEPRRRPPIPSPFPAPQAEPEAEPAAAHSFEAELAAGSPPA